MPTAQFPGAIATDAQLTIAGNRIQTSLTAPMSAGDTIISLANTAGIVPDMLLSIGAEIVFVVSLAPVTVTRGFDSTVAAPHAARAVVSVSVDAWHHNVLAAEIKAIEATLGAGLANVSAGGTTVATLYNFAAQTPAGSLVIGANSITLTPVPIGVNGTDLNHYLYISNGAGTPEAVLIIGGTAVSGAAAGTVIVTCANTHSGAWTIRSATAGISEAISVLGGAGGVVTVPGPGAITTFATVWMPANTRINLGFVQITGPATAPVFRLAGNFTSLAGVGPGASTISSAATSGRVVLVSHGTASSHVDQPEISNLTIDVSGAAGSAIGLDIASSWYGTYRRLYVTHSGAFGGTGDGVVLRDADLLGNGVGGYFNSFEDCRCGNHDGPLVGWGGAGFHSITSTIWNVTHTVMLNCFSSYNTIGINLDGSGSGFTGTTRIVGGGASSNVSHGFSLTQTDQVTIDGADIEGNGGAGIAIVGVLNRTLWIGSSTGFSSNTAGNITGSVSQLFWDQSDHGGLLRPTLFTSASTNLISPENGANNAIAGSAPGITLQAFVHGLTVQVLLAHTLAAATPITFNLNGTGALAIKSSRNPASNIAVGYVVNATIVLTYNGPLGVWMDMSQ